MLEMKKTCEACGADLPADQEGAMICSYECTFCTTCTGEKLAGTCPNCDGVLRPRPTRMSKA